MNEQKTRFIGYPDKIDTCKSCVIKLNNNYILDGGSYTGYVANPNGIRTNGSSGLYSVYLNLDRKEYKNWESKYTSDSLFSRIIDFDPIVEYYVYTDTLNFFSPLDTNMHKILNDAIAKGELESKHSFKRLK